MSKFQLLIDVLHNKSGSEMLLFFGVEISPRGRVLARHDRPGLLCQVASQEVHDGARSVEPSQEFGIMFGIPNIKKVDIGGVSQFLLP